MMLKKLLLATLLSGGLLASCNNAENQKAEEKQPETIQEEAVVIMADTVSLNSFVAFGSDTSVKKPIVLIVPEWWGIGDYVKTRARQLAELGYFAVAVDMYGNGQTAADPAGAQALATPFYGNPEMARARLAAALEKAKSYPQADPNKSAAIGYCFGGAMVLNSAKLGLPVNGVVSFHGNLKGVPVNKDLLTAKILVCHGGSDPFVPAEEVAGFKSEMDALSIPYTFKEYANATHAFTNPEATAKGKQFSLPIEYNATADSTSWADMKTFFSTIF